MEQPQGPRARALSLVSIRVVETVPGKSCMALERLTRKRQMVRLSESSVPQVIPGRAFAAYRGARQDIGGQPVVADLAKMPHLLVAGTHRLRQIGRHQRDDPVAALQE